jgi:hypothetical protein
MPAPNSLSARDAEYLATSEARSGQGGSAEAADVSETVKQKALERWSTDELKTALYAGMFDYIQRYEVEGILRQREFVPDRKLARRTYNSAAWALAFSLGTFIVALAIFGVIASGYRLP